MTIVDLRKKMELVAYLGFDEIKKMWVYSFKDIYERTRTFGVLAGQLKVIELLTLQGLNLCKQ
ncbi:hypothetical protein FHS18_003131 [Paenibacillus phyllosphaerae]|uniref:Uncharacterized protein n=1 Tax=Paenibacillus phyllosphaerae TaxID=274593 RepID=A0A7W5AYE9_9BACL|nr:hypothetical protein [Paenibacillus phyllosphaerae]MBB3111063.1 hypothetical protein [Paenibacillus phyllosphaerae]